MLIIPDFEVTEEEFLKRNAPKEVARLYFKYIAAKECNRKMLDFDAIHEYKAQDLIELLQRFGITQISISSSWSDLPRDLWPFIQAGCTLGGMCQVNEVKNPPNSVFTKPAIILNIPL